MNETKKTFKRLAQTKNWSYLQLRIREDQLEEIQEILVNRPGLSRNAWILESINEKIEKDTKK